MGRFKKKSKKDWDHWLCSQCDGKKKFHQVRPENLIVDSNLSVEDGAIVPWPDNKHYFVHVDRILVELSEQLPFDLKTPWEELEPEIRNAIFYGVQDRTLYLTDYNNYRRRPVEKKYKGLIDIFQGFHLSREEYGVLVKCDAPRRLSPIERIEAIVSEHGGDGRVAFLLTTHSLAKKFTNSLAHNELRFRVVPELLSVDKGELEPEYWGSRRWVIFVHKNDFEIAVELLSTRKNVLSEHGMPVTYIAGSLCQKEGHEFELYPCSWCHTGHDFLGKESSLEGRVFSSFPPNTL
jgi:hypothetical protein